MKNRSHMEHKEYEKREEYKARQINASVSKFSYCKTSYRDVYRYLEIIRSSKREHSEQLKIGPVACLGVRNAGKLICFGSRCRVVGCVDN